MPLPNEDKINSTISGLFETNNYFNVEETVSIFDKDAKDNAPPKTRVEVVLEELEEKIKMERNQREQLLDQLQLMDVRIDRYDQLIIDIDKEIQPLLDPINDAIDACQVAYDARVTNGCRNALKWVPIGWEDDDGDPIITYQAQRNALQTIKYIEQRDSSIVEEKVGLTDPGTIVKGYYGLKFYRKPLNRDYGSNLVDTIRGNVSAGSTVITITNSEYDNEAGMNGIEAQIGDEITDSVEAPTIFTLGNLPKVTSIGTTTGYSGINTTIQGSISLGSTVLSMVGFGTTSSATIGAGIGRTDVLDLGTTVAYYGIGATTYSYYDSGFGGGVGSMRTITRNVTQLLLSAPAIGSTSLNAFNVGIVSTVPAFFLSTAAQGPLTNGEFHLIRTAESPDKDFNFMKNPVDPVTIGIIGSSNLGIGHTSYITNNTHPVGPFSWHQVRCYSHRQNNGVIRVYDPEPKCGAGRAVYHEGNQSWPIIEEDENETYATEGQIVVVNGRTTINDPESEDGVGSGKNVSVTSVSPGPQQDGNAVCNGLDANVTAADAALASIIAQNLPLAQGYAAQSASLRDLRDEMEMEAFGILQASAHTRMRIDKLVKHYNDIVENKLEAYG